MVQRTAPDLFGTEVGGELADDLVAGKRGAGDNAADVCNVGSYSIKMALGRLLQSEHLLVRQVLAVSGAVWVRNCVKRLLERGLRAGS